MNPLEQNPRARRIAYQVFWTVSLVVGCVQVGFAAAKADQPTWLLVVLSILPFLGAAIGYTAQANVTAAPIVAQPDQVILVEDTPPVDERGAYDASSLLVALACIVVIAVGVVWLVHSL
jgi:hypothetical protein